MLKGGIIYGIKTFVAITGKAKGIILELLVGSIIRGAAWCSATSWWSLAGDTTYRRRRI
jgi:hypothetical protein